MLGEDDRVPLVTSTDDGEVVGTDNQVPVAVDAVQTIHPASTQSPSFQPPQIHLTTHPELSPVEQATIDKDKQSKHLKNLISISIALVALYFTAAGISIRAEALVHSNIVGACNNSNFSNQHLLVIVFSAFAFGPSIVSLPLLVLAFGSLFYSLYRARRLYTASFEFGETRQIQQCQREFFKDLIKEVVGITAATVVIGYLSGDPKEDRDIHQACHGNLYEQAFKFIQFMNDVLALMAIGCSFLSLMIGFVIGIFWVMHELTTPSKNEERESSGVEAV